MREDVFIQWFSVRSSWQPPEWKQKGSCLASSTAALVLLNEGTKIVQVV